MLDRFISMEALLDLLKDGTSRSVEQLAAELHTGSEDVLRRMELLERAGLIRRVLHRGTGCGACTGCGGKPKKGAPCAGCLPDGGFANMGEMWEVVKAAAVQA